MLPSCTPLTHGRKYHVMVRVIKLVILDLDNSEVSVISGSHPETVSVRRELTVAVTFRNAIPSLLPLTSGFQLRGLKLLSGKSASYSNILRFILAINLISNLLQVKQRSRYTCDKCLIHPWLQVSTQGGSIFTAIPPTWLPCL